MMNGVQILEESGIENAHNEARWIGECAKGNEAHYLELLRKRASGVPLVRITGEQPFFENAFVVHPNVFSPRPETETLVEVALEAIQDIPSPRILDIGVGTGVILLSLLHKRKDAIGFGIDISMDAIQNTMENARRLGVTDRLTLNHVDHPPFDLIVSNPPYIPEGEFDTLSPEVRDYDPKNALVSGPDGLSTIRRIISFAPSLLKKSGTLVMEFGLGQEGTIQKLLREYGYRDILFQKDLFGITRVARSLTPNTPKTAGPSIDRLLGVLESSTGGDTSGAPTMRDNHAPIV